MAGEMIKTEAICLGIHPWSRTSHVTNWLTPVGRVLTIVKGAVRPKSAFLGQYDLNYTCEILYYAHAKGELHALRECFPLKRRDFLRSNYRALVLAEHFRHLASELAPEGPDAREWYDLLTNSIESLHDKSADELLPTMLKFEKSALLLSGVWPEIPENGEKIWLHGDRKIPISPDTAIALNNLPKERNCKILLDAARVISVLYTLNLELAVDSRRSVLQLICNHEQGQ